MWSLQPGLCQSHWAPPLKTGRSRSRSRRSRKSESETGCSNNIGSRNGSRSRSRGRSSSNVCVSLCEGRVRCRLLRYRTRPRNSGKLVGDVFQRIEVYEDGSCGIFENIKAYRNSKRANTRQSFWWSNGTSRETRDEQPDGRLGKNETNLVGDPWWTDLVRNEPNLVGDSWRSNLLRDPWRTILAGDSRRLLPGIHLWRTTGECYQDDFIIQRMM